MGKAVLIILLSSGIMFSIVSLNTNKILEQATSKAIDYHSQIRARNIANSMVSIALSKLSDDNDYRVSSLVSKNLLGGNVSYTVTDNTFAGEPLIRISTEATYMGMTKKVITYTKTNPLKGPPFFDYSILAGKKLSINGSNNTFGDDNNPLWNANSHSNGETIINGQNFLQEGFASYSDGIVVNGLNITFVPNQNPEGDPVHFSAPEVTIPDFKAEDYESDADEVYNGDKTFSGTITMGTKNNPKIIYVDGKLFISGTVIGYGIFIVTSDIEIKGDLVLDTPDPATSKLALYTDEKLIVNVKNIELHAQILAMNKIAIDSEELEFHGSMTSQDDVTINPKNHNFYYKPANPHLISPFWEVTGGSGGRLAMLYYNEE